MQSASRPLVKVWDGFVRFFHWTLLISFGLAYWTVHAGMQETHAILGYFITALICARLIWGLIGTSHARFANFIHSPFIIVRYLKSIADGKPARYLGHNPAGGIMVMALLVALLVVTVSGLVVLAGFEYEGPLLAMSSGMTDEWAYAWRELHEIAVNVILGLVALHLSGVLLASLQHKENLVRSMVTGYKQQH